MVDRKNARLFDSTSVMMLLPLSGTVAGFSDYRQSGTAVAVDISKIFGSPLVVQRKAANCFRESQVTPATAHDDHLCPAQSREL